MNSDLDIGVSSRLTDVTFIVFDLETTGFSPQQSGITEIGAVTICNNQVVSEFQTFVNPGHSVPSYISAMTGIHDHHVADAPTEREAVDQFLQYALPDSLTTDKSCFVAHNANFDLGFLKHVSHRDGLTWPDLTHIDTLHVARRVQWDTESQPANFKLDTLADFFQTSTIPTHRALDDARATATVLLELIKLLPERDFLKLEAFIKSSNLTS